MNNLTSPLLAASQPNTVIRMGTVSSTLVAGATTVFVTVGGAIIEAGILQGYYPIIGDLVAVAKQDSSWLILGSITTATTPPPQIQTGANTVTIPTANEWALLAVTFAVPFSSTPVVVATASSGITIGSTTELEVVVSNRTTTGFEIRVRRGNTNSTTVNWIATNI